MAVAAYAALLSLKHVLDNVKHPVRRHRLHVDTERIQSLQEKVEFLQEFLEVHSQSKSQEIEDLARQIAVVAVEADDVIDLHVVDQLREASQYESHHLVAFSSFCQDIDKVIQKIDSIMKELTMVKLETSANEQEPLDVRSTFTSSRKDIVVGPKDQLYWILDQLTRGESNLRIFTIIGMGGLGKTTLARLAFNHQFTVDDFVVRIWLTISEEYNARKILLGLLNDGDVQESSETFAELGERLYKRLSGEKYLIVMDDLWSTKFGMI
ncbi:UNVERIFIED_CONTAM: putative disease resistance protein RGA1 [Sesamum latifolium]|uniref:Disease resistance protein RGA1 n=1 Tax=Sesamum latifolium TaxID=2727402 RepID=A0AAW2UJ20_9LAMI